MKKLFLFPILLFLMTSVEANTGIAIGSWYVCMADRVAGVSESQAKDFPEAQNGKVEPDDRYIYLINYTENGIHFTNWGNKAEMEFYGSEEKDGFKHFFGSGTHTFKLSTSNNDFEFIAHKANFYAEYLGVCEALPLEGKDNEKNNYYVKP